MLQNVKDLLQAGAELDDANPEWIGMLQGEFRNAILPPPGKPAGMMFRPDRHGADIGPSFRLVDRKFADLARHCMKAARYIEKKL